jgi:hypothetical protein
MGLRKSRLLKILAVLLFSVEILSPALVFPLEYFQEETKVSIGQPHNQNLILSLLIEEVSSETERDGKDDKEGFFLPVYNFTEAFLYITPQYTSLCFFDPPYRKIVAAGPSRFTLNCTYLI